MLGLGLSLPEIAVRGRGNAIAALFSAGQTGAWFDPSDMEGKLGWRRNLLTYTEDFGNAAWTKANSIVEVDATAAPDGTATADRLSDNSAGGTGVVGFTRNFTITAATHTFSFYAKADGLPWVALAITGFTGATVQGTCYFDLANGVVGASNQISGTITDAGDGWYRCIGVVTPDAADVTGNFAIYAADGNGDIVVDLDGTSTIFVWGTQLEVGSSASAYQPILGANGYSTFLAAYPSHVLYQDTAGTQPVTAPGQTVALMLDKSKGLALGSELATNGGFDDATGWTTTGATVAISGGKLNITAAASGDAAYQLGKLTAGKTYKVTFTIDSISGTVRFYDGTAVAASRTSPGTYTQYFVASGTSLGIQVAAASTTAVIDDVSVRELPGHHATQATASKRPTYGIRPKGGVRNLLTYTEQFDNAAWPKTNITATPNAASAPDGSLTADKFEATAAAATISNRTVAGAGSAIGNTFSIYAKQGSGPTDANSFVLRNNTTATNLVGGSINYSTGAITYSVGSSGMTAENVGDGWWRVVLSSPTGVSSGDTLVVYSAFTGGSETAGEFAYLWGAQLETGSSATAYQKVVSAYEVTESGQPTVHRLVFDGVDDAMATGSIDFTASDEMFVLAGVGKLSDAAQANLIELSASIGGNNGGVRITAPDTAGGANYNFRSKGTSIASVTVSGYTAPVTSVLAATADISGDSATMRVNGGTTFSDTIDQGTGNFGNHALYIGGRAGTSLYFNGELTGLVVRGGTLPSAANINAAETEMAAKTASTFVAPIQTSALAPMFMEQSSGAQTYDISGHFTGATGYSLVSPPSGVTINGATGVISTDTSILVDATVTVRASNAVGSTDVPLFLMVLPTPTIWVDGTNGNDANDGLTSGAAKQTINAGLAALAWGNGQRLAIRGGTYALSGTEDVQSTMIGASGDPHIVAAYDNEAVIIDGAAMTSGGCIYSTDYYTWANLTVRNARASGIQTWNENGLRVVGCTIHGCEEGGVFIGGDASMPASPGNIIEWNRVYDNVRENVGEAFGGTGGWARAIGVDRAADTIVRYNWVYQNYGEGIGYRSLVEGDILSNWVYDNYSVNIYLDNVGGTSGDQVLIQANRVFDTGDTEYYRSGDPADGILISNEASAPVQILCDYITATTNTLCGVSAPAYWDEPGGTYSALGANVTLTPNTSSAQGSHSAAWLAWS